MQRVAGIALLGTALALGAGLGYSSWRARARAALRPVVSAAPGSSTLVGAITPAAPGTLIDPLIPDRPVALDTAAPRADRGDWVNARPSFQYSHSAAQRGGVEPCATRSIDTSAYEDWAPLGRGRFTAPRTLDLDASGHFDLVIHLHGDEPVRRELAESRQHFVLYALTLPPNQGYAPLFTGSHLLEGIVSDVEQALSKRIGRAAHVGHLALSAWSAGFVGVEAALAQPSARRIDAVVLIDGLHAPRGDRTAFTAQLKPFLDFAQRAAAGERFMLVSHSSIDPPDFASTTECAHYLIACLGGRPEPVRRADARGLELVEYFSRGDFHVRGYAGNDKADHCAQLGVLRDAYAALGRRWAAGAAHN
jgi:hypothetical protein